MAVDGNDTDERKARIHAMNEEFRAARKRRLVQRGIALWQRAEADHLAKMAALTPPPGKPRDPN